MERTRALTVTVAVCTLVAGLNATASGKVICVDDAATGANNGSSWADAFHFLQPALREAEAGDEIWLAQGIYKPNQGIPAQPPRRRSISVATTDPYTPFHVPGGITLRGGFAGLAAADPDARDIRRYETVLSGDLEGNDDDRWGPWHPITEFFRRDNSYYVVVCGTADSTTTLDGLVITAATSSGLWQDRGNLHVTDCVFTGNCGPQGGAIWSVGGTASLSGCTFTENVAENNGGAISFEGYDLMLSDCHFLNNACLREGGALYSRRSNLSLIDCRFVSNAAELGGALALSKGTLELTGTHFEGNMAATGGAAVVQSDEAVVMRACDFRMNRAVNCGGAIMNGGAPLILEGCLFNGNSAGEGGAVHSSDDDAILSNCVFAGNQADTCGGALFCGVGTFIATHCTFTDNRADKGSTLGVSFSSRKPVETDAMVASNCILWDGGPSGVYSDVRNVILTYSNVRGGWPGVGNINVDPCFADVGHWDLNGTPDEPGDDFWVEGDYHLKSQAGRWNPVSESWVQDDLTSPCIDAGDPNSEIGDEPFPNGGRINMGAYGGTAEASKSLLGPVSGTSRYAFLPDHSTLLQSGGFAGVHRLHRIEGRFRLTIDLAAGTAAFSEVEAVATYHGPPPRTLDPNEALNMTALAGTVSEDGAIRFVGKAANDSDVVLTVRFEGDLVRLVGDTIPPAGSADFFVLSLDALARRTSDPAEKNTGQ